MGLILKIAAGIIIGFLSLLAMNVIFTGYNERKTNDEQIIVSELISKATLFRNSIDRFYKDNKLLPRYIADTDCSTGHQRYKHCPFGQKDSVFYIHHKGEWIVLDPFLLDDKIEYNCQTSILKDIKFHFAYSQCKQMDISSIPTFEKPTFNCNQSTRTVEKLICASDRLTELDVKLTKIYNDKMQISSKSVRDDILSSQINFIKMRDAQCKNALCIEKFGRKRIIDIEMYEYN